MMPTYPAVGDGVTVRLACCIPHCRRTFRNDRKLTPWSEGSEVICGKHWRSVDPELRARHKKIWKLVRTIEQRHGKQRTWFCARRTGFRIWAKIKTAATERAMGIG